MHNGYPFLILKKNFMYAGARIAYAGYRWGKRARMAYKARQIASRAGTIARATGRWTVRNKRSIGAVAGAGTAIGAARNMGKRRRTSAPTQRKRKKGSSILSRNPGVTTKSYKAVTYKMPKAMYSAKKLGNVAIYRTNTQFGLVGTNGLQAISGDIAYNPANTGLPTMYSATALKELYDKAAIAYNQNVGTGTGNFNTVPISIQTGKETKFFIKSGSYEIHLSNQGPATTEVDVYWLMSKQSDSTAVNPHTVWNDGLVETAQGRQPTDTVLRFPGCKPTESKQFNMHYKILDVQKCFMVSGADHVFRYKFCPNRILDTAYINDLERINGITLQFMIVAKGSVADSNNGKAVGTVTTTDFKLCGIVTERYTTQLLNYWPRVTYYDNKLSTDATGALWEIGQEGAPVDTELGTNYA